MLLRVSILVFLLAGALPNNVFCWEGKVVGVTDGDTIKVMSGGRVEKVRLFGVDCPEQGQDFATKAKQFTSYMVFGKMVEVEPVNRDKYGRIVAWVTVDGKSLNRALVRSGMAWRHGRYAGQDNDLRQLEEDARKNRTGLWSHPNPVPPWKFRRHRMDEFLPGSKAPADGALNRQCVALKGALLCRSPEPGVFSPGLPSLNTWEMQGLIRVTAARFLPPVARQVIQ